MRAQNIIVVVRLALMPGIGRLAGGPNCSSLCKIRCIRGLRRRTRTVDDRGLASRHQTLQDQLTGVGLALRPFQILIWLGGLDV